jgi:hypothetical protein
MHYIPVAPPPQTTAIFRDFKKSTAMCKVHNVGLWYIKRAITAYHQPKRNKSLFFCSFLIFKGLVAGCHSFLFIFHFFITYIHSFSHSYTTFIRRHSPGPLSISSSLESSVGRPSLWCRAENRTPACLTASRRCNIWSFFCTPT